MHKTLTVVTDKEDSKLLCTSYSHMTGNVGNVSERRAGLGTYRNATNSSPHSLTLHFNGHSRMSPFWILLELRVIDVMVTTGAIIDV